MKRFLVHYTVLSSQEWEGATLEKGNLNMEIEEGAIRTFPVFQMGDVFLRGPSIADPRKGRPPATVLAVVEAVAHRGLPIPIWVEIDRPQEVDFPLDKERCYQLFRVGRAKVLLYGEEAPRLFQVHFGQIYTESPPGWWQPLPYGSDVEAEEVEEFWELPQVEKAEKPYVY